MKPSETKNKPWGGAGDTVRAAQLSDPNRDLRRSIDAMHQTIDKHLTATNDSLTRETW